MSICRAYDKERKGKGERPFDYFEKSFLPRRHFESLDDLNRQISDWLNGVESPDEGNARRHGTTGEVPRERWLEEKEYLIELPTRDLLPRRIEERLLAKDATISVDGTRYTVPARLVEEGVRKVWVSIGEEEFAVQDKTGEVVARHAIQRDKKLVIDEAHYKDIGREARRVRQSREESELVARFSRGQEFLDSLRATLRSIAPIHLREVLALSRRYRPEEVEAALERALEDGTTTAGYVRQLLERRHPTGHLGQIDLEKPRGLTLGVVDPGSSGGYEGIFGDAKPSSSEFTKVKKDNSEADRKENDR